MDLRSLECFVAVAEEGSVSRAAVRLHMSQPPLSVRLQTLERELGVTLLVRHGRGVDLTAPGRLLLERGRRLLAELQATAVAVRAVGEGTQGRLAIACGLTVPPALVGTLLAQVRESAPDVVVDVAELPDDEVLDRVRGASADAGLIHLPPERSPRPVTDRERGHEVAVVAREPLVAVLPADHPQAREERACLLALRPGGLVVPARSVGPALHAHAVAAWRAAAPGSAVGGAGGDGLPDGDGRLQEAASISGVLALVRAGLGIALLPAGVAELAWAGLVSLPLRQHVPTVATAVAWQAEDDAPVLRRFLRAALATPEPDVLGPALARTRPPVSDE